MVTVFAAALSAGFLITISFSFYAVKPAWCGIPHERVISFSGIAAADSRKLTSGGYILELELESVSAADGSSAEAGGRVLMFFRDDPAVSAGRRLSAESGLRLSDEYRNVLDTQRAGEISMLRDKPKFTANPVEESIVRAGWKTAAAELRAGVKDEISSRCEGLGEAPAGLFAALFTGSRDSLPAGDAETFRRAGCSHILALSGMHLGILSGIILLLLKPLPGRKPAFIISCIIITAYLYLTGFGVSLVRAALMYFFCGFAVVFYRQFRGTDVLLLSFTAAVIIAPQSFYTVSFQLSFLAVGGILVAAPVVNRVLKPYLPLPVSAALACSVGAQLLVTPLLLNVFGEIYPAGLIAGIIIAPMVTVFIWIGIIYLITGLGPLAAAASLLYRAVSVSARAASTFPAVDGGRFPFGITLFCAGIICMLVIYSLYRRKIDGLSG